MGKAYANEESIVNNICKNYRDQRHTDSCLAYVQMRTSQLKIEQWKSI